MYNVELYINRCLMSCVNQGLSYSEYEIIVINDGSIDNSLKIAEELACKFSNIKIYSQSNSGLSVARNVGLQKAIGKYVWFVDSDDWIEDNCLNGIVHCLKTDKPDILQLQYRKYYDDVNLNKDFYFKIDGVKGGEELMQNGGIPIPAPFAIYNKSFLDNNMLNFYPSIFHEDCEFKPKVLFWAKRCTSYDIVVYNYYQRTGGSITTSANSKHAFDYLTVAISIHNFYKNVARDSCASYFHNYISMIINNALSTMVNSEREFSKALYKQKYLFNHLLKSSKLKYRVEGLLFTIFPHYTATIYKFLKLIG